MKWGKLFKEVSGSKTRYWQTKDWQDPSKSNFFQNANRDIYTYIGGNADLTASSNEFSDGNLNLTAAVRVPQIYCCCPVKSLLHIMGLAVLKNFSKLK